MEELELYHGKKCKTIKGWIIKATKKALLISLSKNSRWVPKSAIVNE